MTDPEILELNAHIERLRRQATVPDYLRAEALREISATVESLAVALAELAGSGLPPWVGNWWEYWQDAARCDDLTRIEWALQ